MRDRGASKDSATIKLPDTWLTARVHEIGSVKLGRQRSPLHQSGKFTTPYLRVANVHDGYIDCSDVLEMDFTPIERETFSLLPGDILLNEGQSLELVGRSAVYEGEPGRYCFQNTLVRFRAYPPNDFRFCRAVFKQWIDEGRFASIARQTTSVAHLGSDRFASMIFPVPSPCEQVKIARILTTTEKLIEKTEALIAKYQVVKQGIMHDLFTRGVDEYGHLRPPHAEAPQLFKAFRFGWIPKEWDLQPLGEVASVGGGVTLGRQLSGTQTIELPYLRVANVQDGYLNLSEIKTVEVFKSEVERYSLLPGDVLMTEGGDFDKLGRGTVWRGQISPCLHQNHIFRVRPDGDHLNSDYLAGLIASNHGKNYFLVSSKQTTNLATINSSQLKAFPVPLPTLTEQERIVNSLLAVGTQIEIQQRHAEKLLILKSGLMQDLLTGKVRVHIDLAEEAVDD